MSNQQLLFGCVADDFTGASDIASFLRSLGMTTLLCNGVPAKVPDVSCGAIVIALKTRTAPVKESVEDSLRAIRWLRAQNARQLYVKYCSTFDSTKEGNIGPILDAALEELRVPYTLLCPSLPVNGRTVRDGKLYVNGVPLHETSMRNHPLTPMWDADLGVLMREQSKYPCMKLSLEDMRRGKEAVDEMLRAFGEGKEHFYVVPDYYEQEHADLILSCFGELPLLSGGSGLLGAECLRLPADAEDSLPQREVGKTLLLAGSCSEATLAQIEHYRRCGKKLVRVEPGRLMSGQQSARLLWEENRGEDEVLFYSSDKVENVRRAQENGKEKVSRLLEQTMSELASLAARDGYTQIIVAGGETSGAVILGLEYHSFLVGESIAPGVPVMIPTQDKKLRLVLKSGNFGQEDFFLRAVRITAESRQGV